MYIYVCVRACVCVYKAIRCRTCTLSRSERLPQETLLVPVNIYRAMLKTNVGMYIAPRVKRPSFPSDFDKKKTKFFNKCMQTIPPLYCMTVGLPILALLFAYRRNERAILLPADRNANVIKKG